MLLLTKRGYWFTAILAPRFLASAFSSGPALLILLSFVLKRITKFKVERDTTQAVAIIVAYALVANIFFLLCEVFVVFYSDVPSHVDHFIYLFKGLNGHNMMVPWMWTSIVLLLLGAVLLVVPSFRKQTHLLIIACLAVFLGTWIDKGLGLMVGGFTPNPFHRVVEYVPTIPEVSIVLGIYGIGLLVLTILYKIVIHVRESI